MLIHPKVEWEGCSTATRLLRATRLLSINQRAQYERVFVFMMPRRQYRRKRIGDSMLAAIWIFPRQNRNI